MKLAHLTLAATCLATAPLALAETACSPAIGFNKVTCKGNSDTLVAVPFDQKPAFVGVTGSAPSENAGEATITPAADVDWTANGFSDVPHYVRFTSGDKSGFYYAVTGNTSGEVTVDLNGDSLTQVASGDAFRIVPFWTLSSLFVGGDGVHAATSAGQRDTEVFFPDTMTLGVNKSASATYYFLNGNWKRVGDLAGTYNDLILLPSSALWIRHNVAEDTVLCVSGRVPTAVHAIQMDVDSGENRNDIFFSLDRPIGVTLVESGLVESGAFVPSASAGNRADELFVYDNETPQFNKAPSATYYYLNGNWKKVGDLAGVYNDVEVFNPGTAAVIRKSGNGGGAPSTIFGLNSPNY